MLWSRMYMTYLLQLIRVTYDEQVARDLSYYSVWNHFLSVESVIHKRRGVKAFAPFGCDFTKHHDEFLEQNTYKAEWVSNNTEQNKPQIWNI